MHQFDNLAIFRMGMLGFRNGFARERKKIKNKKLNSNFLGNWARDIIVLYGVLEGWVPLTSGLVLGWALALVTAKDKQSAIGRQQNTRDNEEGSMGRFAVVLRAPEGSQKVARAHTISRGCV